MLVYAQRGGDRPHEQIHVWLEDLLNGDEAFGVADLVLSGFVRVVTHPRIYARPTSLSDALDFCATIRGRPNWVDIRRGDRHWEIFTRLCRAVGARGNTVPDAYLAALAIESGCELITTDRGFARFSGLRWRDPAAPPAAEAH